MKKNIAALLVFVMVFAVAAPAIADYRTGSAAGDAAAYGAGGAVVGGGVYAAVMCFFGVACPPAAIGWAAVAGCASLGWYGLTEPDKTLTKDVVNVVIAGGAGYAVGREAATLINEGIKAGGAALQAAY